MNFFKAAYRFENVSIFKKNLPAFVGNEKHKTPLPSQDYIFCLKYLFGKMGGKGKSDKVRKISGAQVKSKFYNGQSKRSYLREEEIRETIPFLKKPRRKGIVCMFPSEKNAH